MGSSVGLVIASIRMCSSFLVQDFLTRSGISRRNISKLLDRLIRYCSPLSTSTILSEGECKPDSRECGAEKTRLLRDIWMPCKATVQWGNEEAP